jgi:hypothetical protein
MMADEAESIPKGYSYAATAGWFIAGGIVTAVFSGSLAVLAVHARWMEVLAVGMIVPSFTWVVQSIASFILLPLAKRRIYWGDLGRICLLGSFALLPAAIANLCVPGVPLSLSIANVLASVVVMAISLFVLSKRHGINLWWPTSWCTTISTNMCLFVWSSRGWW